MFLTQSEFAKELGVSIASVARWETGENDPTMKVKRKLNDISNYDVSLYLDFNIIITNLDLVDDEQKKILVSNIKSKILELKELLNERQSHRQHIPNVGKQMFKQQLALVETLEKWIIDFENSLKGQN